MFIHDPVLEVNLADYGILVPSKPEKIRKPLEYLERSLADFARETWFMPVQKDLITRAELERNTGSSVFDTEGQRHRDKPR